MAKFSMYASLAAHTIPMLQQTKVGPLWAKVTAGFGFKVDDARM
jgi:hypothetical protein